MCTYLHIPPFNLWNDCHLSNHVDHPGALECCGMGKICPPPLWLELGWAKSWWRSVPICSSGPGTKKKLYMMIIIGVIRKLLKIVSMKIALFVSKVRMAERSKAPDSRVYSSLLWSEHSGPRMRAWVRIPLLTQTFYFSDKITEFSNAQAAFRTLFMFF